MVLPDHLSAHDHLAGDVLVVVLPILFGFAGPLLSPGVAPRALLARRSRALTATIVGVSLTIAVFSAFFWGESETRARRWHERFVE